MILFTINLIANYAFFITGRGLKRLKIEPLNEALCDAYKRWLYLNTPNTFFKISLPVPTGSLRIFFSSSPIIV